VPQLKDLFRVEKVTEKTLMEYADGDDTYRSNQRHLLLQPKVASVNNAVWMEVEGKHTGAGTVLTVLHLSRGNSELYNSYIVFLYSDPQLKIRAMILKDDLKQQRGTGSTLAKCSPQLVIVDANYGAGKHEWDKDPWTKVDFEEAVAVRSFYFSLLLKTSPPVRLFLCFCH